MKHSTKKFLKRPEFPGGKTAFKEYVKKNLVYPGEALEKGVEGVVHLNARIDDNGQISEVVVEKGIGFGCDEEAARLINNIHYGAVSNKGVRVKTRQRFRIEFRLPEKKKSVSYHLKKSLKTKPSEQKPEIKRYSYTININNK
ncbi:MAG: energy transducer TonB [Mariniphaga sp.]|nr:energy transducer TonB [Mariniphaga sp.]